jgi:hypothetical protein
MKMLFCLFILTITVSAETIKGKVSSPKGCSQDVMVWLSLDKDNYKERLLLMHTEVPVGGSFQFYVKPGSYQVRASDKNGCEFFARLDVTKNSHFMDVKMVKK